MLEHSPMLLLLFLSLVGWDVGEGAMGVGSNTHLSKKFKMFEEYFEIMFKINLRTSKETCCVSNERVLSDRWMRRQSSSCVRLVEGGGWGIGSLLALGALPALPLLRILDL